MTPFKNNLQKGDTVMHADTKRPGKVAFQPGERNPKACIVWQGTQSPQSTDIMKLRLCVNGVPEDVPPCDGVPPEEPVEAPNGHATTVVRVTATQGEDKVLAALREERDRVVADMVALEGVFKVKRASKERLEQAILVFTAPPKPVIKP